MLKRNNISDLSNTFIVEIFSNYDRMFQVLCLVWCFINNYRNNSNLCKDFSADEIINSLFIQNSYLSDLNTVNMKTLLDESRNNST